MPLKTPVIFIIFNRPDKTALVFEAIRHARPKQLFIVADGPRTPEEAKLCEAARAITEKIDWECDVRRNYREKNWGVKRQPPAGISWAFEQIECAIILEDDCVPHSDFFRYCEELLEKYKDDERVMHISGDSFEPVGLFARQESYWFSRVPYLWGWATWRRAWRYYDEALASWPQMQASGTFSRIFPDPAVRERWRYVLNNYYTGKAHSWDGGWILACLRGGLCVNPAVNLVTNIGAGLDAAHPNASEDRKLNIPTHPIPFPLLHPQNVAIDEAADAYSYRYVFDVNRTSSQRVRWFLRSRFPVLYAGLKRLFR